MALIHGREKGVFGLLLPLERTLLRSLVVVRTAAVTSLIGAGTVQILCTCAHVAIVSRRRWQQKTSAANKNSGGSHSLILKVTVLHCTALPWTFLHCTALHCTALHFFLLHCTELHKPVLLNLHSTALHCTALHCTVVHYTTLHFNEHTKLASLRLCNNCAGQFPCILDCPNYINVCNVDHFR